jgi:hypothetical protein
MQARSQLSDIIGRLCYQFSTVYAAKEMYTLVPFPRGGAFRLYAVP